MRGSARPRSTSDCSRTWRSLPCSGWSVGAPRWSWRSPGAASTPPRRCASGCSMPRSRAGSSPRASTPSAGRSRARAPPCCGWAAAPSPPRDRGPLPGDPQLLHGRHRLDGGPGRPHPRGKASPRRPQHGLDELREVLGAKEGVRLRLRLREHLQGHRLPAPGDEASGRQARAGVLRRRAHQQHLATRRPGPLETPAAVQLHHGRPGRNPRHGREPRRPGARGAARLHLGGSRHLARTVAHGGGRPRARRQRARRAGGQLLPGLPGHADGQVERRAGREGRAHGARRGTRAGHRRRGARSADLGGALVAVLAGGLDLRLSGVRGGDGTGAAWFRADVGIRGDRIVAVGDLSRARARRRIELRDRMVAPGFIDMLGQSERFLLADDRVESKIRQGITTEITGEGESIAPTAPRLLVEVKPFDDRYGIRVDWSDLNGYFQRFRATVNLGTFFGAATARALVLGYGDVEANPAQLQMMQRLVGEAIEQGALGLSTALIYPPGSDAPAPELIELAEGAARPGGVYATNARGGAGEGAAPADTGATTR